MTRFRASIPSESADAAAPPVKFRARMTPYGWEYLVLTLLLMVVAGIGKINLIVLMAGIFLAPILLNRLISRRTLRDAVVRRSHPVSIHAGDDFSVAFTSVAASATGRNRRAKWNRWNFTILDEMRRVDEPNSTSADAGFAPTAMEAFFAGFAKESRLVSDVTLQVTERGRYQFGPLRAATEAPFGLYRVEIPVAVADSEMWVFPRIGRFTAAWRRQRMASREAGCTRRPGNGQEFFGVRGRRSGDSLRMLHWRASARHREWIVRQCSEPTRRIVTVLLDLTLPESVRATARATNETAESAGRWAPQMATERGIALVATLLEELFHDGRSHGSEGDLSVRLILTSELESTGSRTIGYTKATEYVRGGADGWILEPLTAKALQRAMQRLTLARAHQEDRWQTAWKRLTASGTASGEWFVVSLRPRDMASFGNDEPKNGATCGVESRNGGHVPDGLEWINVSSSTCNTIFEWEPPDALPAGENAEPIPKPHAVSLPAPVSVPNHVSDEMSNDVLPNRSDV